MKTTLIAALALGAVLLVPATVRAEETMYEWQQRQDLENRIEQLEAAQREAEMDAAAEAHRERSEAHQAYLQSSYGQ